MYGNHKDDMHHQHNRTMCGNHKDNVYRSSRAQSALIVLDLSSSDENVLLLYVLISILCCYLMHKIKMVEIPANSFHFVASENSKVFKKFYPRKRQVCAKTSRATCILLTYMYMYQPVVVLCELYY